jgi:hypothetical protein
VDREGCCSPASLHSDTCQSSPYYQEIDRLDSLSALQARLLVFCVLPLLCVGAVAQTASDAGRKLLHGSIYTAQGQPAPDAAVEIWDLHGTRVASGVTDVAGNFEISGAARPGEYVFVVASSSQIRDEQVLLTQPDLELSLALPGAAAEWVAMPERYLVSAKRLGVPTKAWTHLAAAQREFRKMKCDAAEREIDDALREDPAFARAFTMRAFIRLAEGDASRAVEDAKRGAELDPDDAESFIALAMAYNSRREFHEAAEVARHALALRPDSWQGRLELAKSFYGQGDFVVALRELDLGNVDFPDAHLVRGNVMMNLGRRREAVEEFNAFLREAPNDSRSEQLTHIVAILGQAKRDAATSDAAPIVSSHP